MVEMRSSDSSLSTPKRVVRLSSDSERSIVHTWQCSESVTALAHSSGFIFAGTDRGSIRAFDVTSYAYIGEFKAHDCSVLALECRGDLLYSGSSDSLVKTWDVSSQLSSIQAQSQFEPELLYTIYSTFDIGEVFCIELLPCGMLYIGAQNASISWINPVSTHQISEAHSEIITKEERESPGPSYGPLHHPAVRPNKFFDSAGPGGRLAPPQHRSKSNAHIYESDETLVAVPPANRLNFAHNGFVYCMRSFQAKNTTTGATELRLASGSSDGTIKIWAVNESDKSLTLLRTISPNGGAILSMAVANSWEMHCGLESGVVLTVDLETYQTVSYDVCLGKPLLTLIASDDLFICSSDSTVFECNARSISGSSWSVDDEVTAQSFLSVEDQRIMTSTRNGTIHLWETALVHKQESLEAAMADSTSTLSLNDDAMIAALGKLVSLETVSSRDGAHWYDGRECATLLKDMCTSFGANSHLLKVDDGNPVLFASFKANKAGITKPARVLFYGHYDVIEASSIWNTNPYTLTPEDGYLYGRGVSDNKGPCVAAIFAVAELLASKRLACDVVFVIEGEEESGSFGFEQVIESHKETIGPIDFILFSNSYWIDDSHPCLNYGLRGIVSAEITINSDEHDAHSGVVGGVYREPAFDLIHLLGFVSSGQGEITIPGFWDNVLPVSDHERELYAAVQNMGPSSRMEDILARWRFPSLTVHGINVSGPGNKTVIPSKVTAATSIRIVPNQTAEEITKKLTDHLEKSFELLKSPNHLKVNIKYTAEPWIGDPTNSIFEILKKAVRREWDIDPLFVREGGSIPMARRLEQIFGAQAAHLPIGQSSDNAHLDNERLRVRNFIGARRILRQVFEELE